MPKTNTQPTVEDQARKLRLQALALLQAAEEIDGVFVSAKTIGIKDNEAQPFGLPIDVFAILKDETMEVYINLPDRLTRVHTFDHDLYSDDPEMFDGDQFPPADIVVLAPEDYKLPVSSATDETSPSPRA